jgi:hypothetical protein
MSPDKIQPLAFMGSISPNNVYAKLFCARISKGQKDSEVTSVFFHLWDLPLQKLLVKHW